MNSKNKVLQSTITDSTMSMDRISELYECMRKETALKQYCDLTKIKYREEIKQYYIVIKRKQYTAKSHKELIEKLYTLYFGEQNKTLEESYTEWMLWRRNIRTAPKTLQENVNEWNHFLRNSELSKMQTREIELRHLEDFYYEITKDFCITTKRLTNLTSVLNGIFKRSVSLQLIPHNPLINLDMKLFRKRCMPQSTRQDNYSLDDRKAILNHLQNRDDVYSLAIQFSFYLCIRIGELCAIRPDDISDGYLYIRRSKRKYQLMNDDLTFSNTVITNDERIKGNKSAGFRQIPLTDNAMALVKKTCLLFPDNEYLFMRNQKQIIGDTFNEELRTICKELNIKFRSSHQIRFTIATLLYLNKVPITQLSSLLGHSNTATTWHYIRQAIPDETTATTMKAILD